MKIFGALLALLFIAIPCSIMAAETGHYVNGVEGLKCGTLPGPGWYSRNYFAYYSADTYRDKDGDDAKLKFDLEVAAAVSRLIWITPKKILGADYGIQIVAALQKNDIKIKVADINDEDASIADVTLTPLILGWHKPKFDVTFAYELFVPAGEYDRTKAGSVGKDMYTHMFDLGGTYFFDTEKSWHASALARYEAHSEKDEVDVDPGDEFHFEWGIGKTLHKTLDLGITGYCQWQVTDDEGADVTWNPNVHDQVFAVGPEISYFHMPTKIQISLRQEWEFGAKDRPEGSMTVLTFMKVF